MDTIYSKLKTKSELLSFLRKNNLLDDFFDTSKALEREGLRVVNGKVSSYNHPSVFEPKDKHKYITTDYAESQVEFVTGQFNKEEDLYNFVNDLYDIFALRIKDDEIVWPYSMPCDISNIDEIKEAVFDNNNLSNSEYRKYLTIKYGKKVQLLSGIHYNFSLSEEFMQRCYELLGTTVSYTRFKSEVYFKLMRNYRRYKFLITMLQGATPVGHSSFGDIVGTSIRTSKHGYRNKEDLGLNFSNIDAFTDSIKKAVKDGKIMGEREVYSSVRLKTKSKHLLEDVNSSGVQYVEIRNIDINPYEKCGISIKELQFLNLLALYCVIDDDCNCINKETEGGRNSDLLAVSTTNDIEMTTCGIKINAKDYAIKIINDMIAVFGDMNIDISCLYENIEIIKNDTTTSTLIRKDVEQHGYIETFENLGKKYKNDAYENRFTSKSYKGFELSTQAIIKEALAQGIEVEIIDKDDNFICLKKDGKEEYIKQATKTSKDNYVSVMAMENKVVTKKIIAKQGVKVPHGDDFDNRESAIKYAKKIGNNFVVKPKSTNFGLGINIFKDNTVESEVEKAIDIAFGYDSNIIIEEYVKGEEYRFLVIDNEVVGVINRIPANVVGDGVSTIQQLVDIKNKDPRRKGGYVTPLERIIIDDNAKIYLHQFGLDENYVPKKDEIVYLRQNSNVSTGGDSIDITDEVSDVFKDIAVNATKAIGAVICGVDIIIDDYNNETSDYSIIELNFNPAIHMHCFPYRGVERNIGAKVIELLEF